tara:strand:+ start:196 stop:921 length:726 start_codon:yes stop_codon:yes gene_type:complete
MIDLYYWPTPNGLKIAVLLREIGLEYRLYPINIGKGDQFDPEFLSVSPNNRIPAIVDHEPEGGGDSISVFESGAILLYLAEKYDQFLPTDQRLRVQAIEWLMWQMGGLGPMLGQNHHFNRYAPEDVPYAIKRYSDETLRLYAVLNRRLIDRDYIAGSYSIADIAIYPWVNRYEWHKTDIDRFPEVKRWYHAIGERPGVVRAYDEAKAINVGNVASDESRKVLFGQTDVTIQQAYAVLKGSE